MKLLTEILLVIVIFALVGLGAFGLYEIHPGLLYVALSAGGLTLVTVLLRRNSGTLPGTTETGQRDLSGAGNETGDDDGRMEVRPRA